MNKKDFICQSEICKTYKVSYFKIKKLRDDGLLHPYKLIQNDREIYYKIDEVNKVLNTVISINDDKHSIQGDQP